MAYTKFNEISQSDKYQRTCEIYRLLPDRGKMYLQDIVPKEVYSAILFANSVINPILDYCDKFFDCKENGFSYELGCYFQKREYQSDGFIQRDIDKFTALLKVYNSNEYPQEYSLITQLVETLKVSKERWLSFEESHPELFGIKND